MNVESVTVVIVADGRALVIRPTPAQISNIEWERINGMREAPSGDSWVRRELDGTATFTLRIEGQRPVNGMWTDRDGARRALQLAAWYLRRSSSMTYRDGRPERHPE